MLGSLELEPLGKAERLVHEGPAIPLGRVRSLAAWRHHPVLAEEREERARASSAGVLPASAALGAVTGSRSLLGPALLGRHMSRQPQPEEQDLSARILSSPQMARLLALLAAAEMGADKSTRIPPRTAPVALAGRILGASLVGSALAEPGKKGTAAAVGAVGAAVSAVGLRLLRRRATERFGLSNAAAGLAEDALALGVGLLVVRGRRRSLEHG
jgi:uncharacterized membrane protein